MYMIDRNVHKYNSATYVVDHTGDRQIILNALSTTANKSVILRVKFEKNWKQLAPQIKVITIYERSDKSY